MKQKTSSQYIRINGCEHFFLFNEIPNSEIIIYLHGGPGQSTMNLAYVTDKDIKTHTMVYYDQRGTGKTLLRNLRNKKEVSLENLLDDLRVIVRFIKRKYGKDKVALLGHSWGSILGTEYMKRHPEDVLCYIGVGQVVHSMYGEKVGLHELKKRVDPSDKKALKVIRSLKGFPYSSTDKNRFRNLLKLRKYQSKYGIGADVNQILKVFVKSPLFNPLDMVAMLYGSFINRTLEDTDFNYNTTDYTDYAVPIFYVLGENDWQVPSVVAAKYFEKIQAPIKKLYWVKHAGHVPNLENTDEFNRIIGEIMTTEF